MSNRGSADDWDKDFQMAKAAGIDGFALNIGVDDFTDTQLKYTYVLISELHLSQRTQ